MTEPERALRALIERPPFAPPPVEELHQRVEHRRVQRTRRRLVLAGLATVAAVAAVVPFLGRSDDRISVTAGPKPRPPATTTALPSPPYSISLDFTVPEGWQTLFAEQDRMVVATHPLSDSDRALALLARDDVSFSSFPTDGVVVVVGGDPVQGKYGSGADGRTLDPGPAYSFGEERLLPGGVRVRRGDIPKSSVRIASYAGPSAPVTRLREAEAIAAGVRLVEIGTQAMNPPPPGSRPGMPGGHLPVPEKGLPEVARTTSSGSALILVAGSDCGYVRWLDAQTFLAAYQPLAAGCGPRPSGLAVAAVTPVVEAMRPPSTTTVVAFRVGPEVQTVSARLADGRSVPAVVGSDGWGLATTPENSVVTPTSDPRIVALRGLDAAGRPGPDTPIT